MPHGKVQPRGLKREPSKCNDERKRRCLEWASRAQWRIAAPRTAILTQRSGTAFGGWVGRTPHLRPLPSSSARCGGWHRGPSRGDSCRRSRFRPSMAGTRCHRALLAGGWGGLRQGRSDQPTPRNRSNLRRKPACGASVRYSVESQVVWGPSCPFGNRTTRPFVPRGHVVFSPSKAAI